MRKYYLYSATSILAVFFVLLIGLQTAFAAEKDKYGGIVSMAMSKTFMIFGYPPAIRAADQVPATDVLQTLVKRTVKGEYEPQLATAWELTPDGKTYTFKLRKGVTFHDGTAFDAQAAKWNIDLWLNAKGKVLDGLKSVDIVDDNTISVNFSQFNALTLFDLAAEAFIASPTAIEKNGKKWAEKHPVGTGPFKYKTYRRNEILQLVRNEAFWQKGRPYLDGVEHVIIKNPMTQIAALKTGEIDGITSIAREHAKNLEKDGYIITHYDGITSAIFGDSKNPNSPWSKRKFREAVAYAIDKETIMEELGYGYPRAIYQPVAFDHPFYNPDLEPRKYNPEKAKKLLAEAGYPNGVSTTLYQFVAMWPAAVGAIQGYLAKVGIDVKIPVIDRPKFIKLRFDGGLKQEGSFLVMNFFFDYLYAMNRLIPSTAKHAPDMARPEGIDEIIQKAVRTRDKGGQKALMLQASKMLYDDVTFIPLNLEARLMVTKKTLKDFDEFQIYSPRADRFTNAWISKK